MNQRRAIATTLVNPDFVKFAESFGVSARKASTPDELQTALRELLAAVENQGAYSCSCMSLGAFSQAAVALAQQHPLQLLGPTEIAQLVHDAAQANKA
mgnify:CR=1 FL=1